MQSENYINKSINMETKKSKKTQRQKVDVEFGTKGFKLKGGTIGALVLLLIAAIVVILGLNYKTETTTTTQNPDGTSTTTTNTQTIRKKSN